jgi:hypothetical protein
MNKLLTLLGLVFCATFLTSCLVFSNDYTPKKALKKNTASSPRYNITYSVDYDNVGEGVFTIGEDDLAENQKRIEKHLKKSGYFSSVSYRPLSEKSDYHIHFTVRYCASKPDKAMAIAFIASYTGCLFPFHEDAHLDVSAILLRKDVKIHSVATSEEMTAYCWLPLLPFNFFWNNWLSWGTSENKVIDFIINDITAFQETL